MYACMYVGMHIYATCTCTYNYTSQLELYPFHNMSSLRGQFLFSDISVDGTCPTSALSTAAEVVGPLNDKDPKLLFSFHVPDAKLAQRGLRCWQNAERF